MVAGIAQCGFNLFQTFLVIGKLAGMCFQLRFE